MSPPEQRLQTILFADIAGSTRLYDQLGDERALALITRCLNRLIARTQAQKGTPIKTVGDEIMSTFELPDQAVSAAVHMHEDVSADTELSVHHMQLRIGLHHGPVISESGDVYGDAVNIAARMVGQAKAGQIITTALTLAMLDKNCQGTARLVDQARIKGKPLPIDIYELSWGHPEELTMITTLSGKGVRSGSGTAVTLALHFQGQCLTLCQQHPVINMGRDATNGIVINDPRVSRLHARIELRKDRFVLVDQSTNGTYLISADGHEALVRRDEIPLPAQGMIGLGEKAVPDSPIAIRFERL
ncbi:MAG: adenylate/guanylate cyclase domain-containing protein [Desulfatitalea sp.]